MTADLKPFWRYYGGKYRAAPKYPKPTHGKIVEPFAGAAGYSLRYPDLDITLVDKYPVIAEIWRYLIGTRSSEIRAIPTVTHVDDLPGWVPEGGRYLVGFTMNNAATAPRRSLSTGLRKLFEAGQRSQGWSEAMRERVASQVDRIRHWKVIEGSYEAAPDTEATWFVDPPYNNKAGSYYVHSDVDYVALANWCRSRRGQVIVCENEGATWLPFQPFATFKAGVNGKGSREVIWTANTSATPAPISGATSATPVP